MLKNIDSNFSWLGHTGHLQLEEYRYSKKILYPRPWILSPQNSGQICVNICFSFTDTTGIGSESCQQLSIPQYTTGVGKPPTIQRWRGNWSHTPCTSTSNVVVIFGIWLTRLHFEEPPGLQCRFHKDYVCYLPVERNPWYGLWQNCCDVTVFQEIGWMGVLNTYRLKLD